MKGEGLEPDSVTYTILMTIFGAAAQPELAWGVYQELRQKAQEDGSGVVLSQRQYGAILAVSCSWNALEVVARLHQQQRHRISYVVGLAGLLLSPAVSQGMQSKEQVNPVKNIEVVRLDRW